MTDWPEAVREYESIAKDSTWTVSVFKADAAIAALKAELAVSHRNDDCRNFWRLRAEQAEDERIQYVLLYERAEERIAELEDEIERLKEHGGSACGRDIPLDKCL